MSTRINNATAVYVIMVFVFAAGLWAILSFGATLKAAHDLAGDWELTDVATGTVTNATINQSGRFAQFRMEGSPPLDCRLVELTSDEVQLQAATTSFNFQRTAQADVYHLVASLPGSPSPKRFEARIVNRTYPRPTSATRPTTVPAHV